MKVLKLVSVMAGLFTMVSTSTLAADLDPPPMRPSMDTGLYVRGDVGVAINTFSGFQNDALIPSGGTFCGVCGSQSIADTPFVGAGIGMEIGGNFRIEVAAEYRGSSDIKAMDEIHSTKFNPTTLSMTTGADTFHSNTEYNGHLRSVVAMVNGYYDIFNYSGFTPYVGAGVGMAYNMIDDLNTETLASVDTCNTGCAPTHTEHAEYGHAPNASQFNLAYALMAGTSYDISEHGKLDIGYRYLNLGSVASGTIDSCGNCPGNYGNLKVNDLASHEMRVGVRWLLGN